MLSILLLMQIFFNAFPRVDSEVGRAGVFGYAELVKNIADLLAREAEGDGEVGEEFFAGAAKS